MSEVSRSALDIWAARPSKFVRDLWPGTEPDQWQDQALSLFPTSPRLAMKAAKGPGKSCVLAWIAWNFALTRPRPRIGCLSISGANLKSGLWQELAIWRERSPLLTAAFEMTATEVFARDDTTRMPRIEARTWAQTASEEQIGLALAGLHAPYVMWLMDESGGMPRGVLPVCEAIFSGDPVEAHVVQAGNAISRTGPLYHAYATARKLWEVVETNGDPDNPLRSSRIPIEHAREQMEQWGGRNSPYVKVAILGEFPENAFNALIGPDEVSAAMKRSYRESDIASAARVLGVDVARFGDDASVIFPRQGLVAFEPLVYRNLDSTQGAGAVARKWADWQADACFVDDTGGYGAGWIDGLRGLGRTPIGVQFAGEPYDGRYYNKRAEIYFAAVEWIKRGGQLPNCPELTAALSQTTYSFRGDKMILAPKEEIKALIGYSPDHSDAFVLTFSQPVQRVGAQAMPGRQLHRTDYDPLREIREADDARLYR